jgi:DedD protein
METRLKQRLVGAAVLVILAVIFIPMLLNTSMEQRQVMGKNDIPPQPADMPSAPTEDFSSRIVPLEHPPEQAPATVPVETSTKPAPAVESPSPPTGSTAPAAAPREPVVENKDHAASVGVTAWVVQLGSFSSEEKAEMLNQKLRKAGFKAFVEPLKQNNGTLYRVRIGPELKRSDADALNDKLKKDMQIEEGIVVHYP